MLLLTTRLGWHFDFRIFGLPLYFEAAGEINVWPISTKSPPGFSELDAKYPIFIFAPALNLGIKF